MRLRTLLAWGVHLYTALGAPIGVWAVFAAFAGDYRTAWLLIAVTVLLDSTDGVMARAVRVWDVLPSIDGRRLDDIVDYFGWVIVPTILLVLAGLLPAWARRPRCWRAATASRRPRRRPRTTTSWGSPPTGA